jgi:PAS domain S-box-containing protein
LDTAEARAEAALRRDATLEAIAFAAQRFLQEPDWAALLPQVLRRLGEATNVSRTYVYENRRVRGELRTALRGQWAEPGSSAMAWNGDGHGVVEVERWARTLERGDLVQGTVGDLPAPERGPLVAHGIRSILLAPISVAGGWWGTIGFDDGERERVWTQVEIDALRASAGTLGAAIGRKRSELQLREAEERFRQIVEEAPAITYQQSAMSTSAEATLTYVSPQVEQILGYPQDRWHEVPGFWVTILHPEDRDRVLAENERCERSGEPYRQEYRALASDGRIVWFRDDAILIRDDLGQPSHWQGVMVDITERRLAEERLRVAEARYRHLVENIPAIVYRESVDQDPERFYLSPQVEQILGHRPEQWTWTPGFWLDHVHPDDRERVDTHNRETNETGERYCIEYRFRRPDGTYAWLQDQATLVGSGEGPPMWQGFMLDVTERREAEMALAETEARWRTLVEQVPLVIYTQAIDEADSTVTNTTYMSSRGEEVLGYTVEEILETGGLWRDILHPDDRDAVLEADSAGNQTGEDFVMDYRMIAKDGRVVWIHDEATVVRDAEGRPRFWQGFMLDITERKAAEARLERALETEREAAARLRSLDEMKNTFLQAVSHDLRTPLAAILGLAVTLERTELQLPTEEARDLATRIAANARKLDRMVADLLDLDRLARGIVEPKLHPTDLGALVRRVAAESELMAQGRLSLDAREVTVNVDGAKVERIVENLLANAVRHTPRRAVVTVRVEPFRDGALVIVEDDGPGIPEDMREAIFEPFRQGPGSPEHSPGVGIGLSLVRRFAELHGGSAWVDHAEFGGASFRVYLPDGAAFPAPPEGR